MMRSINGWMMRMAGDRRASHASSTMPLVFAQNSRIDVPTLSIRKYPEPCGSSSSPLYWFGPPIKEFIENRLTLVTTVGVGMIGGGSIVVKLLM
jgi:hypothetical protein